MASVSSDKSGQKVGAESQEADLPRFLLIGLQVVIVAALIYFYRIEQNSGFVKLLPLLVGGFFVHSWLPMRYRIHLFLLISLGSLAVVLGPRQAVGLAGLGAGLFGICHLPIAYSARVALLLLAGTVLTLIRGAWLTIPAWSSLPNFVLPVLSSMFMFRLIVYMYDIRHETRTVSLSQRLAYFFMLPNVCFPLYPVVDYKNYLRTYYDSAACDIYQKGVGWMYRGVVQLMLYRLVYYQMVIAHTEVVSLTTLLRYMVATYLLYLRISGQFHLIIGVLCLFGFNLPETHHRYYLASSFTDYWRRINIYWKDFMLKIFFNPLFMKLRPKVGMVPGLVVATILVFLCTWLLHSYQWFWLLGEFPLTATDGLFWGVLGALVVVNSVYEVKKGRRRSLSGPKWSLGGAFKHALQTLGMFVAICTLWSLWTSPTPSEFTHMVARGVSGGTASEWVMFATILLGLLAIGVVWQWCQSNDFSLLPYHSEPLKQMAFSTVAGGIALLLLAQPTIGTSLGPTASVAIASLGNTEFNTRDQEQAERGYYEGLLNKNSFASETWRAGVNKPKDWVPLLKSDLVRPVESLLEFELKPSTELTYKGKAMRVNRWGMHARDYEQKKPNDTHRVALLGSSWEMGGGVDQQETFTAVAEQRLNETHAGQGKQYEVLNFAVGAYSVLQNVTLLEQRVHDFQPDTVILVVHATEERRLLRNLRTAVKKKVDIPFEYIASLIEESGAAATMTDTEIETRLTPYLSDAINWCIGEFAESCRRRSKRPILMHIPVLEDVEGAAAKIAKMWEVAEAAGFIPINLEGVYGDAPISELALATWDQHPSSEAHRRMANGLYEQLVTHPDLLIAEP